MRTYKLSFLDYSDSTGIGFGYKEIEANNLASAVKIFKSLYPEIKLHHTYRVESNGRLHTRFLRESYRET